MRAQVRARARRGRHRARRDRPEAADPQLEGRDAEPAQQLVEQDDQLGVDERRVRADHLGVDLRELAVAPRLRALVAKQRPRPTTASPAAASCCIPCSRYARQIAAVASGRSVRLRPPWSANVNISLRTMSVTRRHRGRTVRCPRTPGSRSARSRRDRRSPAAVARPGARAPPPRAGRRRFRGEPESSRPSRARLVERGRTRG